MSKTLTTKFVSISYNHLETPTYKKPLISLCVNVKNDEIDLGHQIVELYQIPAFGTTFEETISWKKHSELSMHPDCEKYIKSIEPKIKEIFDDLKPHFENEDVIDKIHRWHKIPLQNDDGKQFLIDFTLLTWGYMGVESPFTPHPGGEIDYHLNEATDFAIFWKRPTIFLTKPSYHRVEIDFAFNIGQRRYIFPLCTCYKEDVFNFGKMKIIRHNYSMNRFEVAEKIENLLTKYNFLEDMEKSLNFNLDDVITIL